MSDLEVDLTHGSERKFDERRVSYLCFYKLNVLDYMYMLLRDVV